MVYREPTPSADIPDEMLLRRHVAAEMTAMCGDEVASPDHVGDIAAALACLCGTTLKLRAVPDELLALLAAKALWTTGEQGAACRILEQCSRGEEERAALISLYPQAGGPSLALCLLMAAGHVRPSRGTLFGRIPVWTMDLSRPLGPDDVAGWELGLNRRMAVLLGHLAPVWDAGSGRGALEVRGWRRLGTWARRGGGEETIRFCRAWLGRAADERGWAAVPEVLREFSAACH